ncbi:hypothetical protein [Planobispora longispora]|uniref:Uncharacterized protein n=1 Tax=Planobispora longispora TaxID=28887 RepID=A0A8J3W480_9ACTN|nr:hypothetical protein [Planobispora longispora]BFE85824.1 hypothetical protein GCM10020093_084250 [Planobispora longispora]GIH76144.1 hypothetical protein Plo01_25730 [Planobispora longispora]
MQLKEMSGDLLFPIFVPGQATAGTADEWAGIIAPFALQITSAKWIPHAAVTANGTNYFTLNLRNRIAGAGSALAASRSYAATDSTAFVPETMTLSGTPANLLVAAGDVLTVEKVVTASGLAMPDGLVVVTARIR